MKKHKFIYHLTHRLRLWLVLLVLAFGLGLVGSLALHSYTANRQEVYFEATFVEPRQAVIFWKTPKASLGYVKYGASKNQLNKIAQQTNSTADLVHAVVIDDIPLEGLYLSLHDSSNKYLLWPKVRFIKYVPNNNE